MNQFSSGNEARINSNEKSSHWILVIIGAVFLLISIPILFAIPGEMARGEHGVLFTLVFPLAGLGMCFGGWKMRQKYLFFGATPLTPSPNVGQVGGQMGGRIELLQPWGKRSLTIQISCIHTYTSGGGKNSTTHHDIIWQKKTHPVDKSSAKGSVLEFCFDVPADLPVTGKRMSKGKIHWEVMVEGVINKVEFKRHWKMPTEAGSAQSSIIIPDIHKEATQSAMREKAEASVAQQIQTETTADGLDIVSEQGRNKSMSLFMTLFGAIFTGAGVFLFYQAIQGELMLWLMAPIFFTIGFSILAFGIFLIGRKLECKIIEDTVYVRRSLFGKIIYTREGQLNSADQLILKSTMSSQQGSKKTEYMALYATVTDVSDKPRKLKLVEGIEGRGAGEAMERKVSGLLNS